MPTRKKLIQNSDRNWIKPPNTIVHQDKNNNPEKLSYWTDEDGNPKPYTKEQLAVCNILTNLNFVLVRALILLDTLNKLDEDTKVKTLLHQDFAKFTATEASVFNHFINLMAAVPDITFGEFLGFLSTNSNPKLMRKMGKKTLKSVMEGKNVDITNFYTSDLIKQP